MILHLKFCRCFLELKYSKLKPDDRSCGMAGYMAFQSAKYMGEQELIRVDYEKYLLGEDDFIIKKSIDPDIVS